MSKYDGEDLITWGFKPGPAFPRLLEIANALKDHELYVPRIIDILNEEYEENWRPATLIPLQAKDYINIVYNIDEGRNDYEKSNVQKVQQDVEALVRVPTVRSAVVMPDACPAGLIPVGTIIGAENAIHPGMHSADICCSMFLTTVDKDVDPSKVLDAVQKASHFGFGGRVDHPMGHGHAIIERAKNNRFLASVEMFKAMSDHLATQGDGNHFFYVGKKESTGELTFVTHHGSRKPGALLYKKGMKIAKHMTQAISPDTPDAASWIPYDTMEGEEYWEALQIIREWTKMNHQTIHNAVMQELGLSYKNVTDTFWNEHNFVFKENNMFYHAKGATPVTGKHAHDADWKGRTIVPLNMGEPILITTNHENNETGFAPHGAGRNFSRTQYMKMKAGKSPEKIMKEETDHIDARFYSGKPDASELPSAYKDANEVQDQIGKYNLANIDDRILPLGSMMAGEMPKPWLNSKEKKTERQRRQTRKKRQM